MHALNATFDYHVPRLFDETATRMEQIPHEFD
jgi:hypothetical protein